MGIGGSIFLLAVGAILSFAVAQEKWHGINIHVVGWVLMAAGLAGLVITLYFWSSRRRTVVTRQTTAPVGYQQGVPQQGVSQQEYRETRRDEVPPPPPPAY